MPKKHFVFYFSLIVSFKTDIGLVIVYEGEVEFDVKNRKSSIDFLYMKSKCANFASVLLDQ